MTISISINVNHARGIFIFIGLVEVNYGQTSAFIYIAGQFGHHHHAFTLQV